MEIPLDQVTVGDRARTVLGDLDKLATSIDTVGLLHPIVVTDSHELVAGHRRLEAVRKLGWTEIEAKVVQMDSDQTLQAETDENTARRDLRISERVALGLKLEPALKQRVLESKRRSIKRATAAKTGLVLSESERTRPVGYLAAIVAKQIGMSTNRYRNAKEIVLAAEQDPEKYADLVERMDDLGNVDGVLREMKARENGNDQDNGEHPKPEEKATRADKKHRKKQIEKLAKKKMTATQIADRLGIGRKYVLKFANDNGISLVDHVLGPAGAGKGVEDLDELVDNTILSLEAAVMALEIVTGKIDRLNREHLEYWEGSLTRSLKSIGVFKRQITEARNEKKA